MALCLAIYVEMTRVRLEVSPQRISDYSLGYRVVTPWDNVAGIGPVHAGQYTYAGLLLREPRLEASEWLHTETALYPFMAISAMLGGRALPAATDLGAYARGIPLELFVARWRESVLGAEIRRCAPALMAQGDADTA